ncbi:MAG: hypothetical protein SGJ18_01725 [Pseudomonadota bacterium]|nr:hypothetical protein [Pseudomonadota bacterium]
MLQHQEILFNTAPDLISRLQEKQFDFHLGATSTDVSGNGERGKLIGSPSYLINSTPNINERLKEKLLLGADGSNVEKGLEAFRLAFTEPLVSDSNQGFLRSDAFLLVVILSNENDQSEAATKDYINFLENLKSPTSTRKRSWMMHFIGVTGAADENCKTFGDYKDVGARYMELVHLSEGVSSTICTANLKNVLNHVEKTLLTLLTEISLSRIPIVESLRVSFNRILIPNDPTNGWTYNSQKNSIFFHGSFIPKSQTRIEIYFDPKDPK